MHRILVGNQRGRTTLDCGFLSFLVYLVTILYYSDIVWSKDLSAHFFFFQCLIGNFLSFCFLPILLIGNFLLFSSFPFFFLLRTRFMVTWDFGSRLIERLDMTYVSFGLRFGGKGDVPHYFHDTHATMMIWKFYAKLVMHAPMRTLKQQIFMVM